MGLLARSTGFEGGGTGVLAPPRERVQGPRQGPGGPAGPADPGGGGGGGDGDGEGAAGDAACAGRFALGLAMAGISTLFLVLLAVWILLRRRAPDWPPPGGLAPPQALWISTFFLAASSAAVEVAARIARSLDAARRGACLSWLGLGFLLGVAFLCAQVFLWRALWSSGLVPSSSGYAAVFYALTGLHGLHVLGGLGFLAGLIFDLRRARSVLTRRHAVRLSAIYWHFMGAIWLVLFTLLYFVR